MKVLFDELTTICWQIFLMDFNLHVFWGLKGKFKDDTIKELMSSLRCKSVEVINNPAKKLYF